MVNTDHIVAHMRSNPRMVYKLYCLFSYVDINHQHGKRNATISRNCS